MRPTGGFVHVSCRSCSVWLLSSRGQPSAPIIAEGHTVATPLFKISEYGHS